MDVRACIRKLYVGARVHEAMVLLHDSVMRTCEDPPWNTLEQCEEVMACYWPEYCCDARFGRIFRSRQRMDKGVQIKRILPNATARLVVQVRA
jgi:hypothetical protein